MAFNLEAEAARLISVGFHGKSVSDDLSRLLARGVGGVILFSRNVGNPTETFETTSSIKRRAGRPILVALDQEGGKVARLRDGFSQLPSMRALGETGSSSLAREVGAMIGRELRAVGFDMNYAPVLDIDTNPENPVIGSRSFGRTPELVSEFGVALAAGLESVGVAACGKHFPGHGDTSQDSHLNLPRLSHPLERLEQIELAPFRAAIAAGIPALMTAHVIFDALDPSYPATMSRAVLHDLLRQRMDYHGLIVTDDLEMRAIADHFGVEDAVERGLGAGVDQFLCCHNAEIAHRAIDAVVHAAERNSLGREALTAANRRLQAFSARYARPALDQPALSLLRCDAHLALIARVSSGAAGESTSPAGTDPTAVMQQISAETAGRG